MGYMGLNSVSASDKASDLHNIIVDNIIKTFAKELHKEGNQYNTSGSVNVALVSEELFIRNGEPTDIYNDAAHAIFTKVIENLEKDLKSFSNTLDDKFDSKEEHVMAYRRMIKSMKKIVKSLEDKGYN